MPILYSFLYGTNAYSAVFNTTTKAVGAWEALRVEAGIGSFDSRLLEGYLHQQVGDLNVMVSLRDINNDGWTFDANNSLNLPSTYDLAENGYGASVRIRYGDFTLAGYSALLDYAILSPNPTVNGPSFSQARRQFLDAGYQHEFSRKLRGQVNITHNGYVERFAEGLIRADADGYLVEANVAGEIGDNINIIIGGVYEEEDAYYAVADVAYDTSTASAYWQLDYSPTSWIKLTGGLQLNQPSGIERDYSPRAGAVVKMNEAWSMKLLHGKAFRNAKLGELFAVVPGIIVGDENLSPETIQTSEIQLSYAAHYSSASLTYYQSKQKDTIETFTPPTALLGFRNGGEVDFDGLEFEFTLHPTESLEITGSLTRQSSEDVGSGIEDFGFAPDFMATLGVSYLIGSGFSVGLFDNFYDEMVTYENTARFNEDSEPVHWLTLNIDLELNRLFKLGNDVPEMAFSLYGDNLFDEEIRTPDVSSREVNTYPTYDGRAIYGTLRLIF